MSRSLNEGGTFHGPRMADLVGSNVRPRRACGVAGSSPGTDRTGLDLRPGQPPACKLALRIVARGFCQAGDTLDPCGALEHLCLRPESRTSRRCERADCCLAGDKVNHVDN